MPPARTRLRLAAAILPLLLLSVSVGSAKDLVVKKDQTPLWASCAKEAGAVAKLPLGHKVSLRFAIAGSDSPCYSVSAEIDGRTVKGYVSKEALEGIEAFERSRKAAASGSLSGGAATRGGVELLGRPPEPDLKDPAMSASDSAEVYAKLREAVALLRKRNAAEAEGILASLDVPPDHLQVAIYRGQALLQLSRPDRAFAVAKAALSSHAQNAELLAVAGMSLYQQNDLEGARDYLQRSLEREPNGSLQSFLNKIERELAGDKSDDVTYGTRFVLRYEGETLKPSAARKFSAAFESEVNRISFQLGCQSSEKFTVIIQSRENYRNTTGAAEWSGGQFDGKIRVSLPPSGEINDRVRRTLSHEFVHACLSRLGRWPAWLHEGLAQYLSGDRLSREDRELLGRLSREDQLPNLQQLAGGWGAMGAFQASIAYKLALAAAEVLHRDPLAVRTLMTNPQQLSKLTESLNEDLRKELR